AIEGLVVRTSRNGRGHSLTVATKEGQHKIIADKQVEEDSIVKLSPTDARNNKFSVIEHWKASEGEIRDLLNDIESSFIPKAQPLFKEAEDVARKIWGAHILNRQAVMRFHNDADGISAALIMAEFFQSYKQAQQSPTYSDRDAFYDLMTLRYGRAPMTLFLDFGSSTSYDLLRAENVEVVVVDHHPVNSEIEGVVLANPTLHNITEQTTGYVCNNIANMLGKDFPFLAGVSLAGDKSTLPYTEEEAKTALALDYTAFYTGYGNTFNLYKDIVKDRHLMETIYDKARDKMEEAKKELLPQVKKFSNSLSLYYFDAESVGQRREFPATGKLASMLADSIEEPAVIMAYTGRMFSFRLSKKDIFDLAAFVEHLKKTISAIEGGGGHGNAASIRIRDPSMRDAVVSAIIEEFKEFHHRSLS
ncbi:MAG: hypothetical protein D6769_02800, partial [Methanobacteriota archaeon]